MNRYAVILLLLFCCTSAKSQNDSNLFSEANRELYAKHLIETKEYSEALKEYENLWYFTSNPEYALKTTYCYRLQQLYFLNYSFILSNNQVSELNYERHVMSLITNNTLPLGFNKSIFNPDTFEVLNLAELIHRNKFSDAINLYQNYNSNFIAKNKWENAIKLTKNYRKLSPLIAGSLSTLVPGLGKIYAGRTIDGLVGFVSVASFGILAYEGFTNKRYKSVAAWIYAPLAAGFYIGNIYGSAKAAKSINREKLRQIHAETQKVLLSHLD